jgi:hypothetical protein
MKRALLILALLPAVACATAKAKTPEVRPPLDVPPVPPRVIEPLPSTEPASLEPVAELPAAPPATPPRTTRTQPPKDNNNRTEPAKPEQKPETPPDTTAAPQPTAPVPPLRTPSTAVGPDAARQVREVVDRAKRMLDTIDTRTLSADRRANYDAAHDFIKQAEDALNKSDNVLAASLANRAETIARQLGGR